MLTLKFSSMLFLMLTMVFLESIIDIARDVFLHDVLEDVCDVVSDVVINVMIRFSGRSWGIPSHLQENPTEIVAKLCLLNLEPARL